MTSRERFLAAMNFEPFDRLPVIEWAAWWDKTLERWYGEGLPEGMDAIELRRYFGQDVHAQDWLHPQFGDFPKPAHHGAGVMKTEKEYNEIIRPNLFAEPEENWDAKDRAERWTRWSKEQEKGDLITWFTLPGFFGFPRRLFGIENHFYAFYDEPELMKRINEDLSDWHLQVIEYICRYGQPDFMTFGEDMSYNHGSMLSKELYDEFMDPYYRKVLPELKKRNIKAIIDSDGNIHDAAPWFEASGLDGILPLERQSGVDVDQLRKDHPTQIYLGAYDKLVMNQGEEAMRAEFERLLPVAAKGGFIISCDHQTPPGVSLEEYRLYNKLFHEYAEKAGNLSPYSR